MCVSMHNGQTLGQERMKNSGFPPGIPGWLKIKIFRASSLSGGGGGGGGESIPFFRAKKSCLKIGQ